MRKVMVMLVVMFSMVTISSMALAAAWNVPTNVRIVQKSNTDTTGRIYGTIQAALTSITNASASNPYVIKVMPGVYDLGAATVQMKPYVALEGSGNDNTIITSTINNADWNTCAVGTITMADNSSVKNLQVINTAPDVNNVYLFAGIALNNVKATVEGVKVYVGADTGFSGRNAGICFAGNSSEILINNVSSEAHGNGNTSGIINPPQGGGKLTVMNSSLMGVVHGPGETARGINCNAYENSPTITVINSDIEGRVVQDVSNVEAVSLGDCFITISNSRIRANNLGTGGGAGVSVGDGDTTFNRLSILNSEIYSSGTGVRSIGVTNAAVKFANTLVQGSFDELADGAKMVNCYDGNYYPITNK
jgi:pectin methylesterase-like acyl-CoA thioesterase